MKRSARKPSQFLPQFKVVLSPRVILGPVARKYGSSRQPAVEPPVVGSQCSSLKYPEPGEDA